MGALGALMLMGVARKVMLGKPGRFVRSFVAGFDEKLADRLRDRLPTTSYRNQRRERLIDLNQFVGRFGMSVSSQVGGLSPQHEVADPKPRHSPCWGFILRD